MKCKKCGSMTEELWKGPWGDMFCRECLQKEWSGK